MTPNDNMYYDNDNNDDSYNSYNNYDTDYNIPDVLLF